MLRRVGKAQKSNKKVYGHGIKGDTLIVDTNGKVLKSYHCWMNMIKRCYDVNSLTKRPSYTGCTVCEEWKEFHTFQIWYDANYQEGFHLDKDILLSGNKVYSPLTCTFVPPEINTLLLDHGRARGLLPQGVDFFKPQGRYRARCSRRGKRSKHLGYFKIPSEASLAYKAYKLKHIAKTAERHYLLGTITPEVRDALLQYKIPSE